MSGPMTAEQLNALIDQTASDGGYHMLPILWAVRDAHVVVFRPMQGDGQKIAPPPSRPWIALIGDDPPGKCSRGPAAFCADTIARCASAADVAMIHSAGLDLTGYAFTAYHAICGRGVLMVETQLAHHAAWFSVVRKHARPAAMFVDISPPGGQA